MQKICFPVITEQAMPPHRSCFRIKMRKKVESCVAQQYPVKDSVKSDQHYHKPLEELPETEMFAYAVPRARMTAPPINTNESTIITQPTAC